MAIIDQVDSVIAARKRKRDKLLERKQELQDIEKQISESCHEMTLRAQETQDNDLRDQYYDKLGEMISVRKKLDETLESIDAVAKRFDRDYISIATVGREKAGKSRLLQTIGDLESRLMPDMIPNPETGSTFAIRNEPDMREGEVSARISFREPNELMSQVTNYLELLCPDFLQKYDFQFDDIGYIPYMQFRNNDDYSAKTIDQKFAKVNLRKIVEHFDEIKDLFGAPDKTLTDPNLIETFVAQNNGVPLDAGGKEYFNYLAVARVDIYCRFYESDIGKVRFVDTIGLNGLWPVPEESIMLNTIDTECDAAIVLVKPYDAGVMDSDLRTYKLLQKHFKNRKIDQWLYYFINHYVGGNDNSVQTWKKDAEKYGWTCADMRIVDATDPYEVKRYFIEPMMASLLGNIDSIDSAYLKEVDDKEAEFRKELEKNIFKGGNEMAGNEMAEKEKTVKEQVDSIIAARQKKGGRLLERKQKLEELQKIIRDSYDVMLSREAAIQDDELRDQYEVLSGMVDLLTPVQEKLDEAIQSMEAVAARFDRDYISIATVGRERMGKSQLLQSIGNLDNRVVPTSDTGSCTGATSVIWNNPDMQEGEVYARLSFRNPDELVSMVNNYIMQLNPDYLKNHTVEFNNIKSLKYQIEKFKLSTDEGIATDQKVARKNLLKIVNHYDDIKGLFGAPDKTLTNADEIETYVAQNNGKKVDEGGKEYFKYLAVARADIYCRFYADDIGKVRLVDTVGLGALQYGLEEAMLNTVDAECDMAIVVARPDDAGVQDKDRDIYKLLQKQFKNRKINQWLYYFINRYVGRNDNCVETWEKDAKELEWSVADMRIVDASNKEEVKKKFIVPMLESVLSNMDSIDKAYLKEADDKEADFLTELENLLKTLKPKEKIDVSTGPEYFQKGTKCFNTMTSNLRKQVVDWNLKKNERNYVLWNSVQKILNDLENMVPSTEKIQEVIDVSGGFMLPQDVWTNMLHYVRNEVTDRFIAIDNLLEKETIEFKNSLVQVLYDELRRLTPSLQPDTDTDENEEVDKVEWLKTMMDEVLEDDEQFRQIRKAFDFLYQFTFNTRAQLIQEVRRQLYIINPICDEYAMPTYQFHYKDCANAVHFYLTSRMSVIEDELRFHLAKLYSTPNQAFYAAAEEFYDRLTFAGDFAENGELVNMQNVWGFFFQKYGAKVFETDTKRFEAVNALIDSYNEMIQELEEFLKAASEERREYGTAD